MYVTKFNSLPRDIKELIVDVEIGAIVDVYYNNLHIQLMKFQNDEEEIEIWYTQGNLYNELKELGVLLDE